MKTSIYTYSKLGEPRRFKQLQNTAPQALIDSANIWTTTWLYNINLSENLASWILDTRSSKLKTRSSRLETQSSHLETRSVRASRREDWVSSFEHRVSTYFWAVLYLSLVWKRQMIRQDVTITAVQIGLYQFTTCLESRRIHSDQPLLLTAWISGKINLTWNVDRWLN